MTSSLAPTAWPGPSGLLWATEQPNPPHRPASAGSSPSLTPPKSSLMKHAAPRSRYRRTRNPHRACKTPLPASCIFLSVTPQPRNRMSTQQNVIPKRKSVNGGTEDGAWKTSGDVRKTSVRLPLNPLCELPQEKPSLTSRYKLS